jgi:DNA invertase Pin-like site-specific DNA recombinase
LNGIAYAEFERHLTRERTRAGMQAARRRGRRLGRPPSITPEKLDLARRLIEEGRGRAVAARMIGVDPATLRRSRRQFGKGKISGHCTGKKRA